LCITNQKFPERFIDLDFYVVVYRVNEVGSVSLKSVA
jgi:hypothetical protein